MSEQQRVTSAMVRVARNIHNRYGSQQAAPIGRLIFEGLRALYPTYTSREFLTGVLQDLDDFQTDETQKMLSAITSEIG